MFRGGSDALLPAGPEAGNPRIIGKQKQGRSRQSFGLITRLWHGNIRKLCQLELVLSTFAYVMLLSWQIEIRTI